MARIAAKSASCSADTYPGRRARRPSRGRYGLRASYSTVMSRSACSRRSVATSRRLSAPQPMTTARSPRRVHRNAACSVDAAGSASTPRWSEIPSAGTSMSSCTRKPSLQPPPVRSLAPIELPEHNAPDRSAFSQRCVSPARQRPHSGNPLCAQRSVGSTMTRCPSRAQRVRPAFSTTPTISWPGTSSPRVSYALSTEGTGSPRSMLRSVRQIPASAGRISTHPRPCGSGVGSSRSCSDGCGAGCARLRRSGFERFGCARAGPMTRAFMGSTRRTRNAIGLRLLCAFGDASG